MIGIHSKFREESYKHDIKSKRAVGRYLMRLGFYINSIERYGPDILAWKDGIYTWHECEMRFFFDESGNFPFRTVHVPERKERLEKLENNGIGFYWVVAPTQDVAMIIKMSVVMESPRIHVPNRREPEGEYFFDVPIDRAKFRRIK